MRTRVCQLAPLLFALSSVACGHEAVRYPLRAPLWKDTDLNSVSVKCRKEPSKKDANHVACAPEVYVSPLAWDAADNSIFRPLSDLLSVDAGSEAVNVNAFDEVPDSAWFTNRIGARAMELSELTRGACDPNLMLDSHASPDGSWVIDKGKPNGSSPGFRINIKGKGKYMLKADSKEQAERPSAASTIGAAIYNAVGFFTSCEQVVYARRSLLTLTPGLKSEDNSGIERKFDQAALENVLSQTSQRDGELRMQASAWLNGRLIGPFSYETARDDDPNDVIAHKDRRELRGARVLAAWVDHFDAREQNTMDAWLADDKSSPDSSPGYVRHYYLDLSDCLGSEWAWDGISRRLGHSYLLDWQDISVDFLTLGIIQRPWDRVHRTPLREKFGYYGVSEFEPDKWKNEYPNPAFSQMTERDGAWMTRILARFTPEQVAALVHMGNFSNAGDEAYLLEVLNGRLHKILERYLTHLSPITDAMMIGKDRLCARDLAELRGLRAANGFHYSAQLADGRSLNVERGTEGQICVTLPHVAAHSHADDDAAERYVQLTLQDGVARGPLRAFLYDLGAARGYRLVGLERPESLDD